MSKGKHRFERGARDYGRRASSVSSALAILIVTEGEKTEPNYFKAIKDRLKLGTAVVIKHPEGTDPVTLTKEAIRLRDERQQKAKRSSDLIEFDEVWVVFDQEKPGDHRRALAKKALKLAAAEGIQLAASDPCFEFWLLLHGEFTTKGFKDCDAVVKALKKHWPDYGKDQSPTPEFLTKLPKAVAHAAKVRKHHADTNGDGNPSTEVDLLARRLNEATRPHLRFELE